MGLKRSLTLPPSPHCLGNLAPVSAPQDKHCEHASLSFKPSSLYSPTTILKYQRGNCFDFAVLLCSLLIGAGYDAYCVHGYATLEMCSLDQTQELCPLLRKPPEVRPAVSGQGGAQHTCSACSSPLSSRAELGGTLQVHTGFQSVPGTSPKESFVRFSTAPYKAFLGSLNFCSQVQYCKLPSMGNWELPVHLLPSLDLCWVSW